MSRLYVEQIDVFTDQPFAGNPAAVVSDANGLTSAQMQAVAREMNLSETVFVVTATDPDADLQIRWFTPTTEVDLCGHATIACFHSLARQKRYGLEEPGTHRLKVQTRSGTLPVVVETAEDGQRQVWFGLPKPELRPCRLDRESLAELLGVQPASFDPQLPLVEFYQYVLIPIRDLATLQSLHPDPHGLDQLAHESGVWGFAPMTLETVDPSSVAHLRFFAPSEGVLEDPVTGSVHGPMGVYLWRQGIVAEKDGMVQCIGEQGDAMGRPGRVLIRIRINGDQFDSVEIGGRAVLVLEGTLELAGG